jgi:hypothetical protein
MLSRIAALLLSGAALLGAQAQTAAVPAELVGTWTSKANSTMTGPVCTRRSLCAHSPRLTTLQDFYDPVNEKFTEPKHTGISYSFTADGHFEEAYYRAVANRTLPLRLSTLLPGCRGCAMVVELLLTATTAQNPKCPKGIIQWQHGTYEKLANGSLVLKPIKVDGRQLYSDPCQYKNAVYTRYNATELFDVR